MQGQCDIISLRRFPALRFAVLRVAPTATSRSRSCGGATTADSAEKCGLSTCAIIFFHLVPRRSPRYSATRAPTRRWTARSSASKATSACASSAKLLRRCYPLWGRPLACGTPLGAQASGPLLSRRLSHFLRSRRLLRTTKSLQSCYSSGMITLVSAYWTLRPSHAVNIAISTMLTGRQFLVPHNCATDI